MSGDASRGVATVMGRFLQLKTESWSTSRAARSPLSIAPSR
jgi:hypothetical protein